MRRSAKILSALLASLLSSPAWSVELKPCSAGLKPEYKDTNFVLGSISREWRAVITTPLIVQRTHWNTPDVSQQPPQCTQYKLTFGGNGNTFTVSGIAPAPAAGLPDCDNRVAQSGPGGATGRVDVFCVQQGPRAARYVTISWWNPASSYGAVYSALIFQEAAKPELFIRGYGSDSSNYTGPQIDLIPLNPTKR